MTEENKTRYGKSQLACNCEAFKTDSSCDRGSVDTTAFLDFPICTLIDPTPTDTAFPQVDYPVIPFTPPPCACIDIDYKVIKASVENRDDIYIRVDFRSVGDCCEGNYETDIELEIPCIPFEIEGGSESHPVEIIMDCTVSSPEGTFNPGITVDSCTISIDPVLKLVLPQPKELEFTTETSFREADCDEDPGGSFAFEVTSDSTTCTKEVKAKLGITFPHVANITICSDPDIEVASGPDKIEGTFTMDMGVTSDSCGFAIDMCPSINLDIPCPITGQDKISLTTILHWGDEQEATEVVLAEKNCNKCELDLKTPELDLQLPCPIRGEDLRVAASISWGLGQSSKEVTIATVDSGECELVSMDVVPLDLQLPCPLDSLFLIGDEPTSDKPYVAVSKIGGFVGGCEAAWSIHLVNPDESPESSGSSESSSMSSSGSEASSPESSSGGSGASSPESSSGGSGASSPSSSERSSGSSHSSGSDSPEPSTASFTAVTNVECSETGGLVVETTTYTIDFTNHTVTPANGNNARSPEKQVLARQLLAATVKAISQDPSILSIVDNPGSVEAEQAMKRLGIYDGIAESLDDDRIEDLWT